MPSYRFFKLDPASKQRAPGEWIEAADDDQALARARYLATGSKCEVWLQNRLVGIVAGKG